MTILIHKKKYLLESAMVLLLAVFLAMGAVSEEALAANLPAFDAPMDNKNIKLLTKKYDSDGAFLYNYAMKEDESFLPFMQFFYFTPETPAIDALDTTVHEAFHKYTRNDSEPTVDGKENESMKVYVGNKKGVKVQFTPIFRTREIADSIPQKFRSSNRYSLYVMDTGDSMLSDWDGVYGLLNEFGGYCWGTHDNNCLFAYRDRFADTMDTWKSFIVNGESNRFAYPEFKYYILHYLYYAKQNHPAVYKKIMANDNFRKAYRMLESRFAQEVATYDKELKQVRTWLKRSGNAAAANQLIKELGTRKHYNALTKELSKKRYQSIHKALVN